MLSDAFRAAAETKDFTRLDEVLAEDAVFRSPVVYRPYRGREAIKVVLGAVATVFEDFRYTDHIESGNTAVLVFEARIGDRELQGMDMLRFGADGRVVELTVMVRPMSGVQALAERMGELVEAAGAPPTA
jgi:ketosteroid isomerase-like protein